MQGRALMGLELRLMAPSFSRVGGGLSPCPRVPDTRLWARVHICVACKPGMCRQGVFKGGGWTPEPCSLVRVGEGVMGCETATSCSRPSEAQAHRETSSGLPSISKSPEP